MPQADSRLPKRITLAWGTDRLEVDDPIWIAKIVQEMAQNCQPAQNVRIHLSEPRSRMRERMDASINASGFGSRYVDPNAPLKQTGYQVPEAQSPVAAEALKVFLGLELPVALSFTHRLGSTRSEHRMSAVHTAFRQCWHYCRLDELNLCWMFSGYQLYATHQIGEAHVRPYPTETMGNIERRLLNGQWVRWGFDIASPPLAGLHWSSERRAYILGTRDIEQPGLGDSDLEPEDDDNERKVEAEAVLPPSQESI